MPIHSSDREDINGDPGTGDDETARNDWLGTGDAACYYHQNANYNVVAVTDSTGAVVQRISYSAYGRPTFTDANGRTRNGPTGTHHSLAVAWQSLVYGIRQPWDTVPICPQTAYGVP